MRGRNKKQRPLYFFVYTLHHEAGQGRHSFERNIAVMSAVELALQFIFSFVVVLLFVFPVIYQGRCCLESRFAYAPQVARQRALSIVDRSGCLSAFLESL